MKKYKLLLFFIIFILIFGLHTISNAAYYANTKYESVLVNLNKDPILILPVNSCVTVQKKGGLYSKITYKRVIGTNRNNQSVYSFSGYVLNTSLTKVNNSKTNYTSFSGSEETKKEIIKMVNRIVKKDLIYSQAYRRELYYSNTFNEATSIDCSGLCASVYKYSFNKISQKYCNSKNNFTSKFLRDIDNPWIVQDFYKVATQSSSYKNVQLEGRVVPNMFYVVDTSKGTKDSLNISNMQIGDTILMSKEKNKYSHMYMYIGDGRLVESIANDGNSKINRCQKHNSSYTFFSNLFFK